MLFRSPYPDTIGKIVHRLRYNLSRCGTRNSSGQFCRSEECRVGKDGRLLVGTYDLRKDKKIEINAQKKNEEEQRKGK